MSQSDCLVVIPARWASVRFPGKVLAPLGPRSVLEWVWRSAKAADLGPVLVATDDERVAAAARRFGGDAVMTRSSCASGTDRVREAASRRKAKLILNCQGDLPFIKPRTLRRVVDILRRRPSGRRTPAADIATAVIPLFERRRLENPNVVKAALAEDGRALYFSRSPIPYPGRADGAFPPLYEHLGIYAFTKKSLDRFTALKPSRLERAERLEQLRALEAGMTIRAALAPGETPIAIDVPADLAKARRHLERKR